MPQQTLGAVQPATRSATNRLKAQQTSAATRPVLPRAARLRPSRIVGGSGLTEALPTCRVAITEPQHWSARRLGGLESTSAGDTRDQADRSVAPATPTPDSPVVGRFHTGRRIDNRPESLPNWLVSTTTPETAAAVSQLLGGTPVDDWAQGVVTGSPAVRVILDGARSVATEMRLWGPKGLVHHCDGALFLSPTEVQGDPCGCPSSSEERAALARMLKAPQPTTTVTFRLAEHYDLGRFEFSSPSRLLADEAGDIRAQLSGIAGEALCELALELVTVTVAGGVEVSFRRPTLKVIGAWS
jgi:hypothetical protein